MISVMMVFVLGIFISSTPQKHASLDYQFELSSQGLCHFGDEYYQLRADSRLSFFGCWLIFNDISSTQKPIVHKNKQLFIYRDSLSAQDFSRLTHVIKNIRLNN